MSEAVVNIAGSSGISYKLDVFEGPLDLLLFLVTKHKLNIQDIFITQLVEQYLDYIGRAAQDMEIAGEFLEMAARLIYIKTVSLLPTPEEAAALKRDLQGKLIEYSLCKEAAAALAPLYTGSVIFVRKPTPYDADMTYRFVHPSTVLLDSYKIFTVKEQDRKPLAANTFSPLVSRRFVSVTSKIIYVLRRLYAGGVLELNDLYDSMTDRSERVATFLAVLELTKSGRISINDDSTEVRFKRKPPKNNKGNSNDTDTDTDVT